MAVGRGQGAARASAPATRDDFTDGGEDRNIAEPWIPARAGEALMGRLVRVSDIVTKVSKANETAPLAEFGPCVVRDDKGNKVAYRSLAVMLSASLRLRINRAQDIGKVFAIVYNGEVESPRGKMHDFKVVEQKREKLADALKAAGVESADDDLPF